MAIRPESAWKHSLLVPSSPFWVLWNSLHLLALGYICTVVPYMTALAPSSPAGAESEAETLNRRIHVFYLLDVLVNFRACFVDSDTGEDAATPRRVAMLYVQSSPAWFAFDVRWRCHFDLLTGGDAAGSTMTFTFVQILRLVRLAKLLHILKLGPLMDFCEDNLGVSRNKLTVVQLVATIACVAHLIACGFVLAATVGLSMLSSHPHQLRSWIEVKRSHGCAARGDFRRCSVLGHHHDDHRGLWRHCTGYTSRARVFDLRDGDFGRHLRLHDRQHVDHRRAQEPAAVALLRAHQRAQRVHGEPPVATQSVAAHAPVCPLLPYQVERVRRARAARRLAAQSGEDHVKATMHRVNFFHELTERGFVGHIALFLRPVFFPPGSLIVKARDHATEMYFISKGTCRVSATLTSIAEPERRSPGRNRSPRSPTKAIVSFLSPVVRRRQRKDRHERPHGRRSLERRRVLRRFSATRLAIGAAQMCTPSYCELYSLSYAHLAPALDKFRPV